ncbi:cardiolipin synthase [Paenibacillus sp.]|uniref:cardiolipin synthase n=1 Tax=Paenibacillus sp. TaxID=58172 RepID=UPI002D641503|nr:cardiolipin synthase [Paenibacillus sp.]HZG55669.1 cardiolipin synthase [Paenibacillus sp.]
MIWLTIALLLFIFQIATILVAEFRRPSKGIAWLTITFFLPIVGFLVYYFIAREYRQRTMVKRRERETAEEASRHPLPQIHRLMRAEAFPNPALREESRFFGLLNSFPDAAITTRNDTTVLASAQETYRVMLQDIERATDHIHMLYYIWNDDVWGKRFHDALIRKALEGVEVRIIYDGIGAYSTPRGFWDGLRATGGHVHCFLPAFIALFDKRLNYRNHRKITVVDGKVGYVGGINIGDEYTGTDKKLGYWRDTSVRLMGDAVLELQRCFLRDWQFVCGERLPYSTQYFPRHEVSATDTVQIVPSGPDSSWNTILEMYFGAFGTARQRIYVTTPYLIPDQSLLMSLKTAALSGVDVRVVIPGVADSKLTLWASLSYVEELLQTGVRVYRYRKGFMHAKTVIVDDHFASTGTANMDLRSFFSNFEINAAFFDERIVHRFASDLLLDIADSEEIRLPAFAMRGRLQRGKETIGRLLAPLL